MNTPPSKKPKRYTGTTPWPPKHASGTSTAGIADPKFAAKLGELASDWPHLEETMIEIFYDLLGRPGDTLPTREIFRSIINQRIRITIMKTLLEECSLNANRTSFYDETIDEFSRLNGIRNAFLHGLWWSHEDGRIFLAEAAADELSYIDWRPVKIEELEKAVQDITNLYEKITYREQEEYDGPSAKALPQKPPKPHGED